MLQNGRTVQDFERKIRKIVSNNDSMDELIDKKLSNIIDNDPLLIALADYIQDERVDAAISIGKIKQYLSCPICGESKFSGYCGILKCYNCKTETFILTDETLKLCNNCIAHALDECWVLQEGEKCKKKKKQTKQSVPDVEELSSEQL